MDGQEKNDWILESLKVHVAQLEQAGADKGELTLMLFQVVGERITGESLTAETDKLLFDHDEILLLTLASRLAAKRKERLGTSTDPALALLCYSTEQALGFLGREKLRAFLESQAVQLTAPSDFWGK